MKRLFSRILTRRNLDAVKTALVMGGAVAERVEREGVPALAGEFTGKVIKQVLEKTLTPN